MHRKISDRETVTHDSADCVRTWDEKDLFLLIPTLYKTCFSKRCNICSIVLASFQIFQERSNFLFLSLALFFLCWIAGVAESWPLIFITLYQVDQRVLEWLTFTTLASSLTLRIVICSFPRQPTRTLVQRGLTDIEWRSIKTEPAFTKYNMLVLIDGWYPFFCLFVFNSGCLRAYIILW